ncbi:hypothetical protein J2TS6_43980 [Paenibacillus albilobatus]|uniref:YqzN/YkzM domain-containing protein n=1 Tax=Paenibacillus albilobatus TaxID=2716884 RepID=A0A919XI26_9BACL|nr:hypothetical protein [Paenibacillus albilobatus]GIO33257.1 hypothetical protein J2TS6_43980 [Paenibacillus albilobatus]
MAEKPEKKAETTNESKYPIDELSAHAEALFNVRPEVLAGALHGVNQSELTIDEAKKAVDQFLKRKAI